MKRLLRMWRFPYSCVLHGSETGSGPRVTLPEENPCVQEHPLQPEDRGFFVALELFGVTLMVDPVTALFGGDQKETASDLHESNYRLCLSPFFLKGRYRAWFLIVLKHCLLHFRDKLLFYFSVVFVLINPCCCENLKNGCADGNSILGGFLVFKFSFRACK